VVADDEALPIKLVIGIIDRHRAVRSVGVISVGRGLVGR
jgi:hypothetical protein